MYAENGQGAGAGSAPVPVSVGQALAVMDAALDYLNGPGAADLEVASLAGVLESLGGLSGKLAAARTAILARFDAVGAHDADGYGSSASWLAAKGRMTRRAASAQVRQMRQLRDHPELHKALASQEISESWAGQIAEWTRKLPAQWRAETDRILLDAAAAGAAFEDLAVLAQAVWERWRQSQGPDDDPDEGGFDERYLKLGTTLDGVGRLAGNLTAECAESLQAILEALGKKAGPEDDRTEQQRFHDALQLACQLLRAGPAQPRTTSQPGTTKPGPTKPGPTGLEATTPALTSAHAPATGSSGHGRQHRSRVSACSLEKA